MWQPISFHFIKMLHSSHLLFLGQPSLPQSSSWSSAASLHNSLHVAPSLLSGTFCHSSAPETGEYVSMWSAVNTEACYLPAPCAFVVFQVWDISMAEPADGICIAISLTTGIGGTSLSYVLAFSGFPSFLENILNLFPLFSIRRSPEQINQFRVGVKENQTIFQF